MSRSARQEIVSRYSYSLYRWYLSRSQQSRNWNPDRSFDWRSLRQDHNEQLMGIIEGFYAVEQYAPDYTAELTRLARAGYGHSQFQIRWGAEEEKHADLWRNVLLFARARTPDQLERYTNDLRANAWVAPFDTPLEMLFYTVFQERATQLIYIKTAALARAKDGGQVDGHAADPVIAKVASTIAIDEAAHYDFFLALARVHLYYFPQEALEALVKVLRNFVMPAAQIVPNYDTFIKILYESRLFGPSVYGREVAKPALSALGVESVKAVEHGLAQVRATPGLDGTPRSAPFTGCNFAVLESTVRGLFDRVNRYESEVGLASIQPTAFSPVEV
jgi:acyl-[acyl-carrier-protein] desaturase